MANDYKESDIVILGHFAKDIIEVDGISRDSLGGAVYYGGIAGSHMGLKISIITRLSYEDFTLLDVFKKNGVKYFAYPSKQTSGLRNIYSSHNMEFRDHLPLGFAGLFKKEEIPEVNTKYFVIGSILVGEVDIELLNFLSVKYSGKLCLDIQGFMRVVENESVTYSPLSQQDKKKILSKVNILKLDQTEAEVLTNQTDVELATRELMKYGPKEILITHENGITLNVSNDIYSFPWKNKNTLGRTGRGDTAFISYLGSRIQKTPKESLKFSAALTSLKLESPGAFNLPLFQVENLINKEY